MDGSRGRARTAAAIALAALLGGIAPARAEERDPPLPRVEFHGGRLTVAAEDVPLGAVLRAVGEAVALKVPDVDLNETFSGAFADMPLLEALDRLLARQSYTLRYDEAGEPEELVLLSGNAGGAAPAAAVQPALERASPAEEEAWIAQRLTSSDRGARIVAVRRLQRLPPDRAAVLGLRVLREESDAVVRGQLAAALSRVEGDEGVNVLTGLLEDPDPSVRIAGARALGHVAGDAAAHALGRTLRHATDPALRQAALESLASSPQASAKDYLRFVAARKGDPMADAARRALSGKLAPRAAEPVDPSSPCLHAAARPQKTCLPR